MTERILSRLCREAAETGFRTKPLYITRLEARVLAREIVDNLRSIGYTDVAAVEEVLLSGTAVMFGQPVWLKPEARN